MTGKHEDPQPAHRLTVHVEATRLDTGLYLVATPIGTARDITLHALDVLNAADVLAAEDTRVLRHLLDIHGIPLRGRRIVPYHDHNGDRLAREVAEAGHRVHAIPGPSAPLVALSLSGLPTDRFLFLGFPPSTRGARMTWLRDWMAVDATLILFESPRRVNQTLKEMCEVDPNRLTVVARELTKKFEEVIRGTAADLAQDPRMASLKGEVVMLVDRTGAVVADDQTIRQALRTRLGSMTVKDAARDVATELGMARRDVYQIALGLGEEKD